MSRPTYRTDENGVLELEDELLGVGPDADTAILQKMNDKIKKETGADEHQDDEKKIPHRFVQGVD